MLEIKIIQPRDFLKITAQGHYEFSRGEQLIEQLARLNKPPNDYAVLLDLRGAEGYATTADVYNLACLLNDYRDSFRSRMALLVPGQDSRRFANAEFFSLCAGNRGFRVSTFTSFEEAMEWLSDIVRVSGEIPMLDLPSATENSADDGNAAGRDEEAGGDRAT
jgi:hypothetical protein